MILLKNSSGVSRVVRRILKLVIFHPAFFLPPFMFEALSIHPIHTRRCDVSAFCGRQPHHELLIVHPTISVCVDKAERCSEFSLSHGRAELGGGPDELIGIQIPTAILVCCAEARMCLCFRDLC